MIEQSKMIEQPKLRELHRDSLEKVWVNKANKGVKDSMEKQNRIERPQYLQELGKYRDTPLVKILVGIRRCGKSTILEMVKE